MSSERPAWCKEVNCSIYSGYGPCRLWNSIRQNWPSKELRDRARVEVENLAKRDPIEIIRRCAKVDWH